MSGASHTPKLKPPCQWDTLLRGMPLLELEEQGLALTLNAFWPETFDEYGCQPNGETMDYDGQRALYDELPVAHGFAHARAVEIGLVSMALQACGAAGAAGRCAQCPLTRVSNEAWETQYTDLRQQASGYGISTEQFKRIARVSQAALLKRWPERYVVLADRQTAPVSQSDVVQSQDSLETAEKEDN